MINITCFNGEKTLILTKVSEASYDSIAGIIRTMSDDFRDVPADAPTTTALMASKGWYKNVVMTGWFKLKFTEHNGKREYLPCLSFYAG